MNSTPHSSNNSKISRLSQPSRGGERIIYIVLQVLFLRNSRTQISAATGTAAVNNTTSALGLHPGTETVGALALYTAGLKGTLWLRHYR